MNYQTTQIVVVFMSLLLREDSRLVLSYEATTHQQEG
jgi:hypothetical protein